MNSNVLDCATMIQPVLESYSLKGPPEPVLLDTASLKPEVILLMDDFFHVLIWRGQVPARIRRFYAFFLFQTICAWYTANYQQGPQYAAFIAAFKQLLEAPRNSARGIIQDRFPTPMYIETEYEGTQVWQTFGCIKKISHLGQVFARQSQSFNNA